MFPADLFTVSTPSCTIQPAGDLPSLAETHSSRFLPSNRIMARRGCPASRSRRHHFRLWRPYFGIFRSWLRLLRCRKRSYAQHRSKSNQFENLSIHVSGQNHLRSTCQSRHFITSWTSRRHIVYKLIHWPFSRPGNAAEQRSLNLVVREIGIHMALHPNEYPRRLTAC